MANGTPLDKFDLCKGKNVAKPNLGKKLKCQSCDAAFYDMGKASPACPKCEAVYTPIVKGRRSAAAPAPVAPAPKKKAAVISPDDSDSEDILLDDDDDLDDVLDDDDEDDDSLIEDASDLAEDDDDLGEIKDHVAPELSE